MYIPILVYIHTICTVHTNIHTTQTFFFLFSFFRYTISTGTEYRYRQSWWCILDTAKEQINLVINIFFSSFETGHQLNYNKQNQTQQPLDPPSSYTKYSTGIGTSNIYNNENHLYLHVMYTRQRGVTTTTTTNKTLGEEHTLCGLFTKETDTHTSISPGDVLCCSCKLSLQYIPDNSVHSLVKPGWVATDGNPRPQSGPNCVHPIRQCTIGCPAKGCQGAPGDNSCPGRVRELLTSAGKEMKYSGSHLFYAKLWTVADQKPMVKKIWKKYEKLWDGLPSSPKSKRGQKPFGILP